MLSIKMKTEKLATWTVFTSSASGMEVISTSKYLENIFAEATSFTHFFQGYNFKSGFIT